MFCLCTFWIFLFCPSIRLGRRQAFYVASFESLMVSFMSKSHGSFVPRSTNVALMVSYTSLFWVLFSINVLLQSQWGVLYLLRMESDVHRAPYWDSRICLHKKLPYFSHGALTYMCTRWQVVSTLLSSLAVLRATVTFNWRSRLYRTSPILVTAVLSFLIRVMYCLSRV